LQAARGPSKTLQSLPFYIGLANSLLQEKSCFLSPVSLGIAI
jgi:hypothetical protein